MRATVLTDASYDHQHPARPGGWAAYVRIDNHPVPIKGYGIIRHACQDSTEAEVCAALNGIWVAATRGATEILVRSDCMAVQHLINGKVKSQRLRKLWDTALASTWANKITGLSSRHVKGHRSPDRHAAGWVNVWCDRHAKIAMRARRKGRKQMMVLE